MRRSIPIILLAILLLGWPLTYRYTSLGIDSDRANGDLVDSTYYRLRWPGNGVVMLGYVIERHAAHGKPLEPFDLGGTFLGPSRAPPPATWANRLGFWWVNVDQERDPASHSPMAPKAQRAVLVGVPHWLIVAIAGAWIAWRIIAQSLRPKNKTTRPALPTLAAPARDKKEAFRRGREGFGQR